MQIILSAAAEQPEEAFRIDNISQFSYVMGNPTESSIRVAECTRNS